MSHAIKSFLQLDLNRRHSIFISVTALYDALCIICISLNGASPDPTHLVATNNIGYNSLGVIRRDICKYLVVNVAWRYRSISLAGAFPGHSTSESVQYAFLKKTRDETFLPRRHVGRSQTSTG